MAKVRVSINEDLQKAKDALRKVVTFYSLAAHYSVMFAQMGLRRDVEQVQQTYRQSGFRAAAKTITDDMLEKVLLFLRGR